MRVGIVILSLLPVLSAHAWKSIYLKAVDEDGKPLSGVSFTLDWYYGMNPLWPKVKRETFIGKADGTVTARIWRGGGVGFRSAGKEGYVYERYLNDHDDTPYLDKATSKKNPYVVILRKRELNTSFLLSWGDLTKEGGSYRARVNGDGDIPVSVLGDGIIDFRVTPTFDEASKSWTATLWSATGTCSLAVSTRRRYVAPLEGWSDRVTVTPDVYTNPSFTLYVRARTPRLYAMIASPICPDSTRGGLDPKPDFRFLMSSLVLNPYGGREMERDERAINWIGDDLRAEALHALLKEHKYPPRPDMAARMENDRKAKALRKERSEIENVYYPAFRDLDEERVRMQGNPEKLKEISRKVKELDSKYGPRLDELNNQLKVLRSEAHTLNLPEEERE